MTHDDRGGVGQDGGLEHLARVHQRRVERAAATLVIGDDSVFGRQQKTAGAADVIRQALALIAPSIRIAFIHGSAVRPRVTRAQPICPTTSICHLRDRPTNRPIGWRIQLIHLMIAKDLQSDNRPNGTSERSAHRAGSP